MKIRNRKVLSALLIPAVSVSLAWANDSIKTVNTPVDYAETVSITVQKLHSDVILDTEQQAQIAELTVAYFNERQAVLEAAEKKWLAEEAIRQAKEKEKAKDAKEGQETVAKVVYPFSLKRGVILQLQEIEDRHQAEIDQVLSAEQKEMRKAKLEERKNQAFQEAQEAANARNQAQSNK